jgi:hypothetical protein
MKKLAITLFLSFFLLSLFSQNPFEKIGKEVDILTLSKGKYDEFDSNDTLVRMGSVMFNTVTKKVEYFIAEEILISESDLKPYIVGRFWRRDPLAMLYPMDSPYMFAGNSPIMMIDVDGLYKYPVTINHNGHTYEAVFNSKNTQQVKLRLADKGDKSKWFTVTYKTLEERRLKQGYESIGLLVTHTGNEVKTGGDVADVMNKRFSFSTSYDPNEVLNAGEIISAILDGDNGVGLSIVAGNKIDGDHPNYRGTDDGAYLIKNMIFIHGFDVKIIPLLKTYNDSPWYWDDTKGSGFQEDFNTLRAKTIQNSFFNGIDNVSAVSRQNYNGSMMGSVKLYPFDDDPVGITMSFNFSKPKKKSKSTPHTMPKATQKSKNPRFL